MTSSPYALMSRATHMLQWPIQRVPNPRGGGNPQSRSQFGLQAATRLHEVGSLVSADQQAARNTFPGLVHTPSHHESRLYQKSLSTARRQAPKVWSLIGLSRNKVAVGEPAAGSPPF